MEAVVVLHSDQPLTFVADACRSLSVSLGPLAAVGPGRDEQVVVYAELVCAYARLLRARSGNATWVKIADHLLSRVEQARTGEITLDLVDIVDRLHGHVEEARVAVTY